MANLKMKVTTSPTLASGAFDVTFGDFEKVSGAIAKVENPGTSDLVFDCSTSIATNVVTVTVKKINTTTASVTAWANAVTADLSGVKVSVIAEGI